MRRSPIQSHVAIESAPASLPNMFRGKSTNSRSRGDRPLTNPARVPNTLWRIEVNRAMTVM